jgi:hypothetical protein
MNSQYVTHYSKFKQAFPIDLGGLINEKKIMDFINNIIEEKNKEIYKKLDMLENENTNLKNKLSILVTELVRTGNLSVGQHIQVIHDKNANEFPYEINYNYMDRRKPLEKTEWGEWIKFEVDGIIYQKNEKSPTGYSVYTNKEN